MRKRASMILRNTFALLLAVALTTPLFAQDRFIPASDSDPVMGRYLVLFAGDDPAADESTADAIARTYGARIEPYADASVRGAVLHMRPAQARLLSEDLRVLRVEEQPLSGDAAPQAPQPAAAAPARRAAVAEASFSPVTTAETPLWSSGAYEYDDTGNIKKIGSDSYRYDGVGRLVYATALTPGNVNNIQSYGYDEFGNMTLRVTDPHGTFPVAETYAVDTVTNQLTSAQYDDTGNQTTIEPNGGVLAYDAAGMLMTLTAGSNKLAYVYDANDERIVTVELVNGNESRHRYTLRGTDNKIARELTLEPLTMNWHLVKDYVYRGSALTASFSSPTATAPDRHYHLDHLGSTRLVTDASGNAVARLTYWPFGLEAPGSTPVSGDRLKFTGHERDTDGAAAAFNLDYMHARYYNGGASRFLRMDPGKDWSPPQPQSWNMYTYVRNNPVNKTDPTGRCGEPADFIGPRKPCTEVAKEKIQKAHQAVVQVLDKTNMTVSTGITVSGMGGLTGGGLEVRLVADNRGTVGLRLSAVGRVGVGASVAANVVRGVDLNSSVKKGAEQTTQVTVEGAKMIGGGGSVTLDPSGSVSAAKDYSLRGGVGYGGALTLDTVTSYTFAFNILGKGVESAKPITPQPTCTGSEQCSP